MKITSELIDNLINKIQEIQRKYYNESHILPKEAAFELEDLLFEWTKMLNYAQKK